MSEKKLHAVEAAISDDDIETKCFFRQNRFINEMTNQMSFFLPNACASKISHVVFEKRTRND